jgi:FkbM family methyltransferase
MQAPTILQMLTLRGHTFMPCALNAASTIVDLGANEGEFSALVRARYHCRVVAVEANPNLLERIRAVPGVEVVHAAVTDQSGEIELFLSDNIEASTVLGTGGADVNGQRVRVPARTLEQVLSERGIERVDLLKVDIEGAEVGVVLNSPEAVLRRIDQITMEFHDFCGLVTPEQFAAVVGRLEELGFDGLRFGGDNMNWLFVRRGAPGVGSLRRYYLKHVVRNARRVVHWGRGVLGRA